MWTPDTHELAWAAGLFDGEGWVGAPHQDGRLHLHAAVSQSDRGVLDRFRNAVGGLGHVHGPYARVGVKDHWDYQVYSFEGVQAVLAMLWKFLSPVKREQFRIATLAVQSQPDRREKMKWTEMARMNHARGWRKRGMGKKGGIV